MTRRSPKLTVAATFPIHPVRGGGPARVLGLYGAVAALGVDVEVVTLGPAGEAAATTELAPGLHEIRVPASPEHRDAELALTAELGGVPSGDVALALHHERSPAYAAAIRASAAGASAVVACHPYATEVLLDAAPGLPLLYEAQDVETDLKAGLLGAHELLDVVRAHEALACREAAHVLTCADADAERLHALFGTPRARFATVPNGYDPVRVRHTPWDERVALRRTVGLDGFTVLFVGSAHGPNGVAARSVVAAARARPSVHVVLVGSVGAILGDGPVPANVDVTGPVHEAFLHAVLSLADVAVNPMVSGSGTNLKMLEYAGAGIPLVSSAFGARGLGFVRDEHYVGAEPDALAEAIDAVRTEPEEATRRRVGRAYDHVRTAFDWRTIAQTWLGRDDVRDLLALG